MTGVVFIVCVPTEEHEKNLKKRCKKKKLEAAQEQENYKLKSNESIQVSIKKNIKENLTKKKRIDERTLLTEEIKNGVNYETITEDGVSKMCKCMSMQQVIETVLKQLNIENSTWSKSTDNNFIQIIFTLKVDTMYEEVLETLKEYDIGSKYNSVLSVVPCTLHYKGKSENLQDDDIQSEDHHDAKLQSKNSGWSKFLLSMRSRLTVAQVVEKIKYNAALTFDFLCLLMIASTICAIGLVEDSNIYLISSMLISPMMGPVMASTFGKVIRDRMLQKMGVYNELIGLGIATVIGFVYGAIICICTDRYGEVDWPTNQMVSSGEVRTIWVGCLIALLAGAAVALAILSDNISSLVGVAISTSLMPPAVNAGLLWSLASVYYVKGNETTRYTSLTFTNFYSDNRAVELTSLGAVSLCLTFVNIICIYLAGILVFKIKEVAPIASRDLVRRQFWSHDVKVARNFNRTLASERYRDYQRNSAKNRYHSFTEECHHSTDLTHGSDKVNIKRSQYTWSPCMLASRIPTAQEVHQLYNNMKRSDAVPPTAITFSPPMFPEQNILSKMFSPKVEGIDVPTTVLTSPEVSQETNVSKGKKLLKKAKKFVVTPCVDPMRNTCEYP